MQRLALIKSAPGPEAVDGRLARGERTKVKVADALISLLEDGEAQPTAKMVAARAGVSLRLVFHHFEDMDALYRSVIALQAQRYWLKLREISADQPLAHRIDRTVRQRSRLFEAISPVRRMAMSLASRSAALGEALAESDTFLRSRLAHTFAPELEAAGTAGRDLLECLDLATSWEAWERLREGQHLSAVAARRILNRSLTALVGPDPAERGRVSLASHRKARTAAPAHRVARGGPARR